MSATSKLGSLLRRLRAQTNLTQEQLARMSGLSRTQIAFLETGKRGGGRVGWETMTGLAKAFGVSADDFAKLLDAEKPTKIEARRGRPRKTPDSATKAADEPKKRKKKKADH